jgi:hypothetical protein
MKKRNLIILVIVAIIIILLSCHLLTLNRDKETMSRHEVIEKTMKQRKIDKFEEIYYNTNLVDLENKEEIYSKELSEEGYRYEINLDHIEVYIMDPAKINALLKSIDDRTGEGTIQLNGKRIEDCVVFNTDMLIVNWRNDKTKEILLETYQMGVGGQQGEDK